MRDLPYLPSFPTRRSSDLQSAEPEVNGHIDNIHRLSELKPAQHKHVRGAHDKRSAVEINNHRQLFIRIRRSEEHTSELQSRGHLVCRLLLEKNEITSHYTI